MKAKNSSKNRKYVTEAYLDARLDQTTAGMKEFLELRLDQTRDGMREDMRKETARVLQAVDKIATKFDTAEKDHAAHAALHGRITDDLHGHDLRIKKLEARV
ncbi:MAG: hypothetical protein AAB915_01795 [Patescibacteria group bacterium]